MGRSKYSNQVAFLSSRPCWKRPSLRLAMQELFKDRDEYYDKVIKLENRKSEHVVQNKNVPQPDLMQYGGNICSKENYKDTDSTENNVWSSRAEIGKHLKKLDGFEARGIKDVEAMNGFEARGFENVEAMDGFEALGFENVEAMNGFGARGFENVEAMNGFEARGFENVEAMNGFEARGFENVEAMDGFEARGFEDVEVMDLLEVLDDAYALPDREPTKDRKVIFRKIVLEFPTAEDDTSTQEELEPIVLEYSKKAWYDINIHRALNDTVEIEDENGNVVTPEESIKVFYEENGIKSHYVLSKEEMKNLQDPSFARAVEKAYRERR